MQSNSKLCQMRALTPSAYSLQIRWCVACRIYLSRSQVQILLHLDTTASICRLQVLCSFSTIVVVCTWTSRFGTLFYPGPNRIGCFCARLLQGLQRVISDSVLFIYGCLVRRPVVGYLNRPEMASDRLCNTSIIIGSPSVHTQHASQEIPMQLITRRHSFAYIPHTPDRTQLHTIEWVAPLHPQSRIVNIKLRTARGQGELWPLSSLKTRQRCYS